MKKTTLIIILLITTFTVTAQELYFESGKSSTSFEYENSQGVSLENLQATSQSFMAIGYKNKFITENLNIGVGLNYSGYGAISSNDALNNFMEWEVNYVGLNLGFDYNLVKFNKANLYVKTGMSASFFTQGIQTLNNSVIDLKNNDDFDTTLITLQFGAGFSHPISDKLSMYAQYLYGKGLDMIKDDEKLNINSSNFSFGLLINISKEKTTEE